MKTFQKDCLTVKEFKTRGEMGKAAAADVSLKIKELLKDKKEIRMIFAAAPSQNEFLEALASDESIDFTRINAFHMDEYIGLKKDAPQGFGNFLKDRMFSKVPFKSVSYINGLASDPEEECARYTSLLKAAPIDIVCMGIGENAHIAFNDPGFADFDDPKSVKVVKLDEVCRQQQVNDGCFASIDEVPTHALTLTIPALTKEGSIYCMVPAKTKANAVKNCLTEPVSTMYPASVLRTRFEATLYLDGDSASLL